MWIYFAGSVSSTTWIIILIIIIYFLSYIIQPTYCQLCNLLPSATKLGQGYVFTGICHSVNRGGGSASVHAGIHPLDQAPPWEQTPPAQSMLGDTVNVQAVRTLLECNLVCTWIAVLVLSPNRGRGLEHSCSSVCSVELAVTNPITN